MLRTPLQFIKLAPQQSIFILAGSMLSGISQSLTVLSLVTLSDVLGLPNIDDNWIVDYSRTISEFFGVPYNLSSVLLFMVLIITLIALIEFFTKTYSAKVSAKLVRRLRMRAINAVLGAKWFYYTEKKSGEFIHSILTEASKTASGYIDSVNFFSTALQGFVILLSAFLIDVHVAIAGVFSGLFVVYIFKGWVEKARVAGVETGRVLQSVTETITDGMSGMKPLKAMNRDYMLAPLLSSETMELERLQYRLFIVSAIPQILRGPIIVFFVAIGLYIIVNYSLIPIVSLIPLALLFQRSAFQFGATQTVFQSIKKMEPFLLRLQENITKAESMREDYSGSYEPVFEKGIRFNKVSFAYDEKVILDKCSFSIKKKDFIAIIGPSGSGKTTLLDIIIGLNIPKSGELLIDGIKLQDIDINKWRSTIGYVPQDLFLFHDSIANNINLGDPSIQVSKIEKAIKEAGAWEFVNDLPYGLHTHTGERGLKLSGGQRQRISIARALVAQPQLLILDEATTSLDPDTEKSILSTLRNLSDNGITIIAVSHQPRVLEVADQAYKLENGEFYCLNR